MNDWRSTTDLRFVRRTEKGNESSYERTVLQQKWIYLDINPDFTIKILEQWRDVPLEVEDESTNSR